MGKYVAENCVKALIRADKPVKGAKVAVFGLTFKENCPDVRNSKVVDVVQELREYGVDPLVYDPTADAREARTLYNLALVDEDKLVDLDAVILAVAHREFATLPREYFDGLFAPGVRVLLDVKGICDRADYESAGYVYWRL